MRSIILVLVSLWLASPLQGQVDYGMTAPWDQRAESGPDAQVPGWFYNLGITGLRAKLIADEPKALLIKYVFPKSPADGHVRVGDLVVGAGGQMFKEKHRNGYGEKVFGADGPILELAQAIEACQTADRKGKLPLTLRRGKEIVEVVLDLGQKYGTYAPTFPEKCKKSDLILAELLQYLVDHQEKDGSFGDPVHNTFAPLALLASGEAKYLPAVARNVKYHCSVTREKELSLVNWYYMSAAIVLSEYYLATGEKSILPELQRLHDLIAKSQYLHVSQINPKAKLSHPDSFPKGPKDSHGGWGHSPGFEGYGPIAMLTGQGALAYSLLHRCGIEIDRKNHDAAYEFLKRGTGKNGYVWYGDQKGGGPDNWADMGRTGSSGIANFLSPYDDPAYRERAISHARVIGTHPQSFPDTHGSPMMGMGYTALAAYVDADSFRKLMDANRWWFTMAQCNDGSFYYQPNRDNAGYGSDSRMLASSVTAFILTIPKRGLVMTGKQVEQPRKSEEKPAANKPVKVFILAGQSNMEGHGFIPAEPKRNEGKGSLEYVAKDKATAEKFKHLLDKDGKWAVRDDVWIHYLDRKGKLTAGFGVKEDRIGPELGFGHVVGEAFEEPVLLIKLAWGGKSLGKDFRPPSSGGEVGPFYKEIVDRTKAILKDLKTEFPELGDRGYELAGFGWHQGWNDRVNQAFTDEYEKNMSNFIRDIRKDLGVKNLPFVIAESGQGGPEEKHPRALALMKAQGAPAEYEEFKGNVAFVKTQQFWRKEEASPTKQGYHWNSNAETYYDIGDGMGHALKKLCQKPIDKEMMKGWKHSGTLTLLTTPDGANLPATAVVADFPVLVRLHRDWFDFTQARPDGADLRFTTAEGVRLAHQIEEWDANAGTAIVWVRVPSIKGNSRLPLGIHWGNADVMNESDGKAVFNESNGYLSVWHLGETVRDEVGTLTTKDLGTNQSKGVIGTSRHFDGKARIDCGDKIATYPTGDSPHTSEVWFRPEVTNSTLIGWGNEKPQGKVVMQFRGPPHIRMDCWFSGANVESTGRIPLNEWVHVAHICQPGDSRLYVNGVLAGQSTSKGSPLKIANPAGLWIGNWRGHSEFKGDLDEVRVSRVARSADWMRLQYENQKPMQTLVGPLVTAGTEFSLKAETPTVNEGGRVRLTAQAGGAEKIYWSLVRRDGDELLAVDRFTLEFAPARVSGDTTVKLRVKAVFANEVKTRDLDLTVKETIPDPEFTLQAPAEWDGRKELVLEPRITNLDALKSAGGGASDVRIDWSAGPFAVVKETVPGKLRLLRSQNSGPLIVTATLSNGGRLVTQSSTIVVKEPANDAWVQRTPEPDEKPEEGQFYARNDRNEGMLHYNGTLEKPADEVFLKVYADEKPFATVTAKPGKENRYALTAILKPAMVKYRVEFGTRTGDVETALHKVGNLLCGDAFLIEGQSNAEALDLPWETPRETNDWVRTYGGPLGRDQDGEGWLRERTKKSGGKRPNLWTSAVWKFKPPEHETFVGWWGMELGKRLVESNKVPVCLINGALGGTRIDEHQRNPVNPADLSTIYGRWLWRVQQAKLTHGIRAIIWHQGENDQPADGPSGDYGWVNYHRYFIEMAAGWKRDLPNVRHYYAFQIWPDSCAMGGKNGAGDRLRERQRTLPDLFSNLSVVSTLGIRPPGGCHFPMDGYNEFTRLLQPLIERDVYGKQPAKSISPPNLERVSFANAERDTLTLEFDQPVVWKNTLVNQFYLDGVKDQVASGSVEGSTLTLKLKAPTTAKTITYLKESAWSQDNLLVGENGIAALTFCEVPVEARR